MRLYSINSVKSLEIGNDICQDEEEESSCRQSGAVFGDEMAD